MNNIKMRWFAWDHLRPDLQKVSQPFAELARWIDTNIAESSQKTISLQKLLEAKDAAVRAAVEEADGRAEAR